MRQIPTVLALLSGLAVAQEPPTVPSFPSQVELVTVDVVVLDAKGKPVRGLRREDFALSEDGQPQTIASFEPFEGGTDEGATPLPIGPTLAPPQQSRPGARTFVLLVDDLSLTAERTPDVRRAIEHFVSDALRDGDDLLFATTSGDTWWNARMPEGAEDILALAERLRGRKLSETASDYMSEWEAFRITRIESPTGAAGSSSAGATVVAPGSNITDRVVSRWIESLACDSRAIGLCRSMVVSRARMLDQARANRTRDVASRIDRAVFALSAHRGRKALLLMTEGFLNDPDLGIVRLVAGRCREANIAVYTIDVRGLLTGGGELASRRTLPPAAELSLMRQEQVTFQSGGSEALALDTGGFALRDTNDLGGGTVRVADESRVYYLLGFAPPEGKQPSDWRKLRVEVSHPGVTVRARKGYILRSPTEVSSSGPSRQGERPKDVARALLAPQQRDDIPLRARAYAFGSRPGGKVTVVVAVEADLSTLPNLGGESPRSVFALGIAATHRDSGKVDHVDQRVVVEAGLGGVWEGWLALQRDLELPPGVVQARVVLRDEFLGRVGAITIRFEVPDPAGLRLTTPILTDRLRPVAKGTAPVPVLLARREFAPSGRLYCQFQLLGMDTAAHGPAGVESRYLLRHTLGAIVSQGFPGPMTVAAGGQLVSFFGLPLDGLSAGHYELVLSVQDTASGKTLERTEAFDVATGS